MVGIKRIVNKRRSLVRVRAILYTYTHGAYSGDIRNGAMDLGPSNPKVHGALQMRQPGVNQREKGKSVLSQFSLHVTLPVFFFFPHHGEHFTDSPTVLLCTTVPARFVIWLTKCSQHVQVGSRMLCLGPFV